MDDDQQIVAALNVAMEQHRLIAIYNLPEDDNFNVGYVLAIDGRSIMLESIDWDGKIFGIDVIRISAIREIAIDTDYLKTVSVKMTVAKRRGYYDLWHVADFINGHPEMLTGNLLMNACLDSFKNRLPIVVGTDKYQGSDDFEGMLSDINKLTLTIDYYNEHDLSSMWRYRTLLASVQYVRIRGTQAATTAAVLQKVFDYTGPQDAR